MNFFAVLLLSLFISVKSFNAAQDGTFDKNIKINMKSSTAHAQDGTFYENAKNNVNSSTATEEGTFHENVKRNGNNAGLKVVLSNDAKQESQLTRFRRSVSDPSDTRKCYRHYFVGDEPPIGFKVSPSNRYICQGNCDIAPGVHKGCFSTLYDVTMKIPIYSAYFLKPMEWSGIGNFKRSGYRWRKEPDLDTSIKAINENIDSMYSNTGKLPCIHKGHLVPAEIYSFSDENIKSTFVYTNAVPQYQTFNSGQWSAHEEKIRQYGEGTCAHDDFKGDLYLMTGISERRIDKDAKGIPGIAQSMPEDPNIVIPNSMWTAGCCVNDKQVLGSFAVIGNNDPIKDNIYMSQVSVKQLANIIGVTNLFPGNDDCNDESHHAYI